MNIQNAEFLRTYVKGVEEVRAAGMTTSAVDAADFERILGLAQSAMFEAEMMKARHCHHGHGEGSHTHGQQTCTECAGVITYHLDFTDYGNYPDMTPEILKRNYVGRMVYGEAYKG